MIFINSKECIRFEFGKYVKHIASSLGKKPIYIDQSYKIDWILKNEYIYMHLKMIL